METKNFFRFKEIVDSLFEKFEKNNLKIKKYYGGKNEKNPDISFRFKNFGLRKYVVGIWPCGKWSDFYDIEEKDYISFFLIHDWLRDKFRPSSSNIEFKIYLYKNIEEQLNYIINSLMEIKKFPVDTYYSINSYHTYNNHYLEYFSTWKNIRLYEVRDKIEYNIGPIIIYSLFRVISIFDRRIKDVKKFDEKTTIPRYTFGFLSTIKCSNDEDSWRRFCNLYSRIPEKICKTLGFSAYFNVADYDEDMTEKEIKTRMWKGVVI